MTPFPVPATLEAPETPGKPTRPYQPSELNRRVRQFFREHPALVLFLYSALLALGTFALDGRYDLTVSDEGYLRYGVRAILHAGQVPMRDFQSYDPGRYYWVAGWSLLLGDGLVSTRLACTFFQILGVGAALCALRRAGVRSGLLGVIGLVVTCWMIQRFKLFEQCISLLALYPAVALIQQPTHRHAWWAGVFVGLAACMGRNHGLYNAVAFGGLPLLLAWKYRQRDLLKLWGPLAGGTVVGYLPMLLMLAFVPGFADAFLDPFRVILRARSLQLNLAIPWPWHIERAAFRNGFIFCCMQAYGWSFLLLPVGLAAVAATLSRMPGRSWREHAGLVAAGVIGLSYLHYAFSRADIYHLAHSLPVVLVALLLLPNAWRWPELCSRRKLVATLLTVGVGMLTVLATFPYNPITNRLTARGEARAEMRLGEQTLNLDAASASFIFGLQTFARTALSPEESILILPNAPMLYEAVGRLSPVHEIYFLWPPTPTEAQKQIEQLERQRVNWALLGTEDVDNDRERGLRGTHPLLMQYLREHFVPVPGAVPWPYVLLHRTRPLRGEP